MFKISKNLENQTNSFNWIIILFVLLLKSIYVLNPLYGLCIEVFLFGIISLIPLLFFISFSFMLTDNKKNFYLFGINLFISVILFIDVIYLKAFGHLISIYIIFLKGVTNGLSSGIISLIKVSDFLLFIDLPILFNVFFKKNNHIAKRRIFLFIFTSVLTASIMVMQFQNLEKDKLLGNFKMLPLLMSPIGNHVYDIYRFSYEKNDVVTKDELIKISKWHNNNKKYQVPDNQFLHLDGIFKDKNLIVVQFESLENILIESEYYGYEITPNINKLIKNSIYFSNVIEQVRDGNSSDAELLFNTSMYPLSNGSAFLRFGSNEYNSLPKLLDELGYTSIAIHGDDKEFWNRNNVFPNLGFEKYIDETQFVDKEQSGMGILDEFLFSQSLREIKSLKEPFNIHIITMTSHMPFVLPEKYRKLSFSKENITTDYLQSIHYVDAAFGEFYKALQQNGILDNSIIVIFGDHEGIHKYYSTNLPDNNSEIPLIIHSPNFQGFEIDKGGGQVDIMPTLAYLLGINNNKYESTVMGRNLFNENSGSSILPSGEVNKDSDDIFHLKEGLIISDISIKCNYYMPQ